MGYLKKERSPWLRWHSSAFSLLTCIPTMVNFADLAARLRVDHQLKTLDAIQAASAITSGAIGFVFNDHTFHKTEERMA